MHEYVVAHRVSPERVVHVPNWANDEAIKPLYTPVAGRKQHGLYLSTRLLVGYQGNMGRAHDASAILDAAILLSGKEEIRFLLTGGGVGFDHLRLEAERRGLTNIDFRSYVSDSDLNVSLCLPDVHLISLRPRLEGFVVPSKLYSALAAGRGVIFLGSSSGEVASIIQASGAGVVLPPDDGQALADVLRGLDASPSLAAEWGLRARAYIANASSREQSFRRWRELLATVRTPSPSML
jgi:glycosyltransferase involved in cell wall biosynthesis